MDYTVIRSQRKTVALQIKRGRVIVRAPMGASDWQIRNFVASRRDWLKKHLPAALAREAQLAEVQPLTTEELRDLARKACEVIPQRVRHYANLLGVTYGRITIRNQRTRWGSCTSKGNLNFNCLLMLAPSQVLDSVVVHELCHRREMNHSDRFYREVYRVFPQYDQWHGWLKKNGETLMRRMEG